MYCIVTQVTLYIWVFFRRRPSSRVVCLQLNIYLTTTHGKFLSNVVWCIRNRRKKHNFLISWILFHSGPVGRPKLKFDCQKMCAGFIYQQSNWHNNNRTSPYFGGHLSQVTHYNWCFFPSLSLIVRRAFTIEYFFHNYTWQILFKCSMMHQ